MKQKSSSRKKVVDKKGGREEDISGDDLEALENFCQSVEFDEMEFDSWVDVHNTLDLIFILKISADEANTSGQKEIEYIRTITKKSDNDQNLKSKYKIRKLIRWHTKVLDGYKLAFPNEGDFFDEERGNLIVIVNILA